MGLTLNKKIGDFNCSTTIDTEHVKTYKEHFMKNVNMEEFLNNVESGITAYDDMIVVYYDYLDGGIGSVYAYLSVSESKGDIQIQYTVASEYVGETKDVESIPLGEEERLLVALQKALITTTKEFAKKQ